MVRKISGWDVQVEDPIEQLGFGVNPEDIHGLLKGEANESSAWDRIEAPDDLGELQARCDADQYGRVPRRDGRQETGGQSL
jgi:hypothetical protein